MAPLEMKRVFCPCYGVGRPGLCGALTLVSWIGINDCGLGLDAKKQITELFEIQQLLYNVGARNFLFFNLPPLDRTPAGP